MSSLSPAGKAGGRHKAGQHIHGVGEPVTHVSLGDESTGFTSPSGEKGIDNNFYASGAMRKV